MKSNIILFLLILLTVVKGNSQNKVIEQLLDRPLKVTVIHGDTFLQRDLSDYLNFTQQTNQDTNVVILKDYFMRPHPGVSTIQKYFSQASKEFKVPVQLLMVIGQIENNWTQTGPTVDQGWGIMHLVKNNYCNTLGEASKLINVSEQVLKDDAFQNIRGAAALIAKYAGKGKKRYRTTEDWFAAVARFSGLINQDLRNSQAMTYYETLKKGVQSATIWDETIIISPDRTINLITLQRFVKKKSNLNTKSTEYGPALTNLAPNCNYATGRTHTIDTWVMHYVGTGTYAGAISWFLNCSASVSAHFVIRSSDGEITQCVSVANTAWHCGVSGYPYNNSRSIGIEHEATAANPGLWNSIPMLQASATMACYFKNIYDFPATQNTSPGICGHNSMPGTSTACPGALPWSTWFSYFNVACNVPAPQNDACNDAIQLITDSLCNYTSGTTTGATSSGFSSCSGNMNDDDVFYYFNTGNYTTATIQVQGNGSFDPAFQLLSGVCGGSMQQIPNGCVDITAGGGLESRTFFGLSTNTTYYIRIGSYGQGPAFQGNFQVCVTYPTFCTSVSITDTLFNQNAIIGDSVTWNVTPTGTTPYSYQWYKNDSPVSGQTNSEYTTPALTINDSGNTYYCLVTNCSASYFAISDTATLTVYPDCNLNVNTDTLIVHSGSGTALLNITGLTAWNISENCNWLSVLPSSGSGNGIVSIVYNSNIGILRYCSINISCGSQNKVVTIVQNAQNTGLDEVEKTIGDFIVYPNPTKGLINIQYTGVVYDQYTLSINNTLGQIVYQKDFKTNTNITDTQIDIHKFSKGIYFLTINSNHSNQVFKIQKL